MVTATNKKARRSRGEWQQLVEAHAASGLTQAAFCRREGLALSTFQYWKRQLAADGRADPPADEATVIDLGALEERPAGWEVEIALGDGVSLTLRRR